MLLRKVIQLANQGTEVRDSLGNLARKRHCLDFIISGDALSFPLGEERRGKIGALTATLWSDPQLTRFTSNRRGRWASKAFSRASIPQKLLKASKEAFTISITKSSIRSGIMVSRDIKDSRVDELITSLLAPFALRSQVQVHGMGNMEFWKNQGAFMLNKLNNSRLSTDETFLLASRVTEAARANSFLPIYLKNTSGCVLRARSGWYKVDQEGQVLMNDPFSAVYPSSFSGSMSTLFGINPSSSLALNRPSAFANMFELEWQAFIGSLATSGSMLSITKAEVWEAVYAHFIGELLAYNGPANNDALANLDESPNPDLDYVGLTEEEIDALDAEQVWYC